uniref:Uncharacterized protein n=1 Tax=Ditylum brightwellii TaxID=49249 RepID=A0A7S4VX70_9STRA
MPEESVKSGIVPFLLPTNTDEVYKIPRDNKKRKSTGLSEHSDIPPARSLLGQKRSKSEFYFARNAVANNMFVPLPVFSSNNQGERSQMMQKENDESGTVPLPFPTNTGKVYKIPRDNRKRKSTRLPKHNDIPPARSLLGHKRSKSEIDAARNALAMPVFSSNIQRERSKDEIFYDNLQARNRVLLPAENPYQNIALDNDARKLTYEQNMAFPPNSISHHHLPSFYGPPVPMVPHSMQYPTTRPAMSTFDLQQQLDFHCTHIQNLLHQMNYRAF